MDELIARIEAASGPDRELDARIAVALDLAQGNVMVGVDGWVINSLTNPSPYRAPEFTGSLDVALSLAPRGWIVDICRAYNNDGEFYSRVTMTDSFTIGRGRDPEDEVTVSASKGEAREMEDPTPLAVCAAALRARQL